MDSTKGAMRKLAGHPVNHGLQPKLEGVEEGKEERPKQRLPGTPRGEDHQRDADPAAPLHKAGEEAVEGGHGQEGPAKRHQPRPHDHRTNADRLRVQALSLDRMGVLTSHPQGKAQRRPRQDPGDDNHRQKRQISGGHLGKEHLSPERQV